MGIQVYHLCVTLRAPGFTSQSKFHSGSSIYHSMFWLPVKQPPLVCTMSENKPCRAILLIQKTRNLASWDPKGCTVTHLCSILALLTHIFPTMLLHWGFASTLAGVTIIRPFRLGQNSHIHYNVQSTLLTSGVNHPGNKIFKIFPMRLKKTASTAALSFFDFTCWNKCCK